MEPDEAQNWSRSPQAKPGADGRGFLDPVALPGRGGAYNRPLTRPIATARYFLARRRFAQYAFSRFDIAFLAAALIGARFRFCVAVG